MKNVETRESNNYSLRYCIDVRKRKVNVYAIAIGKSRDCRLVIRRGCRERGLRPLRWPLFVLDDWPRERVGSVSKTQPAGVEERNSSNFGPVTERVEFRVLRSKKQKRRGAASASVDLETTEIHEKWRPAIRKARARGSRLSWRAPRERWQYSCLVVGITEIDAWLGDLLVGGNDENSRELTNRLSRQHTHE